MKKKTTTVKEPIRLEIVEPIVFETGAKHREGAGIIERLLDNIAYSLSQMEEELTKRMREDI